MGKLQWFKLYSEASRDRKLSLLNDAQFRTWFNLLCFASENEEERGTIFLNDEEDKYFVLAVEVASGDEELLEETLKLLKRLKIIEYSERYIKFINFEKRQSKQSTKPSDSKEKVNERVKKHREKNKKEECNAPVTPCNAPRKKL